MKTIIAGSRIATFDEVAEALKTCPWAEDISEVVSGCARGADSYGELLAEECNVPIKKFPAQWVSEETGLVDRTAGFKRNQQMADYADALIAVDCGTSGIRDMIRRAKNLNLRIHVFERCLV
jgi:hypothetical protein